MRFEISKRVDTDRSIDDVIASAKQSFEKIAKSVDDDQSGFVAKGVEATFGSINRTDRTIVRCAPAEGGAMIVADVHYKPSFAFWVILLLTLFSYVGWIIPIGFYLYQKSTVRSAVESALQKVHDELRRTTSQIAGPSLSSTADELAKLADLRERGLLTDQEFAAQKAKLLA